MWPSNPQAAMHEMLSCLCDQYSHMGLGVPWKTILIQHSQNCYIQKMEPETLKARNISKLRRSSAKLFWHELIFDRKKVSGHVFSTQVSQTFSSLLGKEKKSWVICVNDKKLHSSYQKILYKQASVVVEVCISGDGFVKVQLMQRCILDFLVRHTLPSKWHVFQESL